MIKWKWSAKGVVFPLSKKQGGAVEFTWSADCTIEILLDTVEQFDKLRQVYSALREGEEAFRDGRAAYDNAAERLEVLLEEQRIAERKCRDIAQEFGKAFDKPGVMNMFKEDAKLGLKFVGELLDEFARRDVAAGVKG